MGDDVTWNFDISAAPRGRIVQQTRKVKGEDVTGDVFQPDRVILATKCGQVTTSRYLPKEDRWEGLATGEQPLAWQLWPEHPEAASCPLPHHPSLSPRVQPPTADGTPTPNSTTLLSAVSAKGMK